MCRVTLVGILALLLSSGASGEDTVKVPDVNLRTVLYKAKKQDPVEGEMVAREILTGIYSINAKKLDIADLTGIEACVNLGEAKFSHNHIRDVSPLAGCRSLQSLDVSHNQIEDVSSLGAIKKLQYLNFEHNKVASLKGLGSLSALNCLYASHNAIVDIRPVSELKNLWTLSLNHNQIRDLAPVADLPRVDSLGLAHNKIEDVSKLPPGRGRYSTYLHGNQISDIGPLVGIAKKDAEGPRRFASFWHLYLAANPLSEESKSQHLDALKQHGVRLDLKYDR